MTEILHIEILRKHGHTDMGITIPRPPPMGGEVIMTDFSHHIKAIAATFITLYNMSIKVNKKLSRCCLILVQLSPTILDVHVFNYNKRKSKRVTVALVAK